MFKNNKLYLKILVVNIVCCLILTLCLTVTTAAEDTEVSLLLFIHYSQAAQDTIQKQAEKWAANKGVKVKIDFVEDTSLASMITSESQIGKGHDIIPLRESDAYLFEKILTDVSSVVEEIQKTNGQAYDIAKIGDNVNGIWRGIPWYHDTAPMLYRKDYIEEVGYTVENMNNMTTDEFLVLAKKLKESGHPIGMQCAQIPDGNATLGSLMYSFGSYLFGPDNTIIIDSKETRQALEYFKNLYQYMPEDLLGWDNSGNNQFMLSKEGGVTGNTPSIYATAQDNNFAFKDQLYHAPNPFGPKGSWDAVTVWSFGIPVYAKNKDLAADLIKYLLTWDNFYEHAKSARGFDMPVYNGLDDLSIWTDNPNLSGIVTGKDNFMSVGAPGINALPSAASQRANISYTVPIMFGKYLTGTSIDEAIKWTVNELKRFVEEENQ